MKEGPVSCVVMFAVGLLYSAQQKPPPQPVFKSEVTAVEVDVVATRKSGEVVGGLGQEDFEVFEDGVPVAITSFVPVVVPDVPLQPTTTAPNRSGSAFGSNDQPQDGRIVLIVLDDVQFGFTAGRVATAKAVARRAVERLHPADLAGVMTTSGGVGGQAELTSDKARLMEAIDSFAPRGEHELPEIANSSPAGEGAAARLNRVAERRTAAAMTGLTVAARALGTIRHRRKSVLLISQGLPATLGEIINNPRVGAAAEAIRQFLVAAQRNNVAIYTFDPCGLETDAGCSKESRANLREMAELTGGFATVNTNAPEAAIDRVLAESGGHYLISYYSPAPKNDGKHHKITVRTRVPDIEIRARAGYHAPRKGEPAAAALAPVDALTRAIVPTRGLTMRVIAIPVPLAADPGAAIVIGIELASAAAARAGRVEFAAVAIDRNGRTRGRVRFATDFAGRSGPIWMRTGSRLDLAPGRYDIRVAAAGADQTAGSVFTEVTVPDFRADLAVGGLSIGGEIDSPIAAADRARSVLPLIPFAANELAPQAGLAAQLPIMVAAKAASQTVTIMTTLTAPDGTTQQLGRTVGVGREYAKAGGRVHQVPLPPALATGRHRLVVETKLGRTTVVRELTVTVVPGR